MARAVAAAVSVLSLAVVVSVAAAADVSALDAPAPMLRHTTSGSSVTWSTNRSVKRDR